LFDLRKSFVLVDESGRIPFRACGPFHFSGAEEDEMSDVISAEDRRLTNKEAAEYLGCCVHALMAWRKAGNGPRAMRIGRKIFFRMSDLNAFIESCLEPMPTPAEESHE
jgi:predicted DNA-binding transcriptional regulator AlpA